MTRRTFLATASAAAAATPLTTQARARGSGGYGGPASLIKFRDPLPIPPVIDARSGGLYSLGVRPGEQFLGLRDRLTQAPIMTRIWGYAGIYPGPTVLAQAGVPTQFRWENHLVDSMNQPIDHLLPVDTSLHWADPLGNNATTPVPIVTHLHGGNSASASDGLPDAWFTPRYAQSGRLFNPVYTYENDQEGATLWYHDHALGITRLNVYAGLAGFYLLRDENEDFLIAENSLPSGPYELGLAIQDKSFDSEGNLALPIDSGVPGAPIPSVQAEFFGDVMMVNAMAWPYLSVEPRTYRLRFLNGCDSRFLDMHLSSGTPFTVIGNDLGLLESPVETQRLLIGPGERYDVILDFRGLEGREVVVRNTARTPYPKGDAVNPRTVGQVLAFRVDQALGPVPIAEPPANLRPVAGPLPAYGPPSVTRKLLLFEGEDEFGRLKPLLGTAEMGALMFGDPVTEKPALGSTEVWEFYNTTMDAHPIHLHLTGFRILNRQKFRADQVEAMDHAGIGALSNIQLVGQPRPPAAYESGQKDTAIMYPGEVTRIIASFDRPGEYVWHCHILSHEDHEMMRPYVVQGA